MTDPTTGLSRRDFCGWAWWRRPRSSRPAAGMAAPLLEPRLRAISRLNDWVGEKILLSPDAAGAAVPGRRAHARRTVSRPTRSR